ncbi:homeobox protein PKNOX2, partial [Trichonephila clavata]
VYNARRRILQPMLDASNPETNHKSKKLKTQSIDLSKVLAGNIASIQPQVQNSNESEHSPTGMNQHCNHYTAGSSTTPDTGHSSLMVILVKIVLMEKLIRFLPLEVWTT